MTPVLRKLLSVYAIARMCRLQEVRKRLEGELQQICNKGGEQTKKGLSIEGQPLSFQYVKQWL